MPQKVVDQLGARVGRFRFLPLGPREQHLRLDVHQRAGHHEELPGRFEIQFLDQIEVAEVFLGDTRDGDVVNIEIILADQKQQEVQRPFEVLQANVNRFHQLSPFRGNVWVKNRISSSRVLSFPSQRACRKASKMRVKSGPGLYPRSRTSCPDRQGVLSWNRRQSWTGCLRGNIARTRTASSKKVTTSRDKVRDDARFASCNVNCP